MEKSAREQPMNVAHLKLLLIIYQNSEIRTDSILPYFNNEKPTLISRINFLVRKELIVKLPKYNRGGNTNPNYYKTTKLGREIAKGILLD